MNDLNTAADALEQFAVQDAKGQADDMARAFEQAGERIASALTRAASQGELSFEAMAESVAQSLARLAINELLISPLENLVAGIGKSVGGQNASNVTVNMNVTGAPDGKAFAASAGQISARLARAVADGQGYL